MMSCANFLSGMAVLIFFFLTIPLEYKGLIFLWKLWIVLVSRANRKKAHVIPSLFRMPALMGLGLIFMLGLEEGWWF